MKKYTNIPLKERKRNAERCYRHEEKLEEREFKRLIKEKLEEKERQSDSDFETDKDREFNEVYERLKAIEKGGE